MLSIFGDSTIGTISRGLRVDWQAATSQAKSGLEGLTGLNFGQVHQVVTQAIESNTRTVSDIGVPTRLPWLTDEILREISHRDWLNRYRRIAGLTQKAYITLVSAL